MYCNYYGFTERPFEPTPDPSFLYRGRIHREVQATLLYGIRQRRGFIVVVGEVGTGKTTLLRSVINQLGPSVKVATITNTDVTFDELLQVAIVDLGIASTDAQLQKSTAIQRLNDLAIDQFQQGGNVVIMVDEAQNLDRRCMENLRLLSNLETSKNKLIQIILSGQPELDEKLRQPDLRQLAQRVNLRRYLTSFDESETIAYIHHRLKSVQYTGSTLFTKRALRLIWDYSGGVPRKINTVCDNALLTGYAMKRRQMDAAVIQEVIADLTGSALGASATVAAALAQDNPNPQSTQFSRHVNWPRGLVPAVGMSMFVAIILGLCWYYWQHEITHFIGTLLQKSPTEAKTADLTFAVPTPPMALLPKNETLAIERYPPTIKKAKRIALPSQSDPDKEATQPAPKKEKMLTPKPADGENGDFQAEQMAAAPPKSPTADESRSLSVADAKLPPTRGPMKPKASSKRQPAPKAAGTKSPTVAKPTDVTHEPSSPPPMASLPESQSAVADERSNDPRGKTVATPKSTAKKPETIHEREPIGNADKSYITNKIVAQLSSAGAKPATAPAQGGPVGTPVGAQTAKTIKSDDPFDTSGKSISEAPPATDVLKTPLKPAAIGVITPQIASLQNGAETSEPAQKPEAISLEERLRQFLGNYCSTYEAKDLDAFSGFFAPGARENGKPVERLFPKYKSNFDHIDKIQYRIRLKTFTVESDQMVTLNGDFFLEWFSPDKQWRENSGNITMSLKESGPTFKVHQLDYYGNRSKN